MIEAFAAKFGHSGLRGICLLLLASADGQISRPLLIINYIFQELRSGWKTNRFSEDMCKTLQGLKRISEVPELWKDVVRERNKI